MADLPEKTQLTELANHLLLQLQNALLSPEVWIQLGVIIAVYFLASVLFTPQLKRALLRLGTFSSRISRLHPLVEALNEFANTLVWLILQWSAIHIYNYLGHSHQLLMPVASLLSAWLLIRLATRLLKSKTTSQLFAGTAWTLAILNITDLLDPTLALLDSLSVTLGAVRISPLIIIKAGLLLWLSLWLSSVLSGLLARRLETSENITPAMRVLSVKLLHIALITAAVLFTFSTVGINLTALAVFGGALGVGLGFGLQKIFSNLISGVILLMDHSIKPGDTIAIGQTFGWINHLSARYVSLITRDGIEHLIPNEILITERVENWSFSDSLVRLRLPVGISYNSDVRKAIELCVESALATPRIMHDPVPRCLLKGFGDSSVELELRVWINDPPNGRANVLSEILLGIWDRFHEHGIEIPFPQRDLHIRSGLEHFKRDNDRTGDSV